MTKREYNQVLKAIKHFMEDEPVTPQQHAAWQGGWDAGMDILADLCVKYQKRHAERKT